MLISAANSPPTACSAFPCLKPWPAFVLSLHVAPANSGFPFRLDKGVIKVPWVMPVHLWIEELQLSPGFRSRETFLLLNAEMTSSEDSAYMEISYHNVILKPHFPKCWTTSLATWPSDWQSATMCRIFSACSELITYRISHLLLLKRIVISKMNVSGSGNPATQLNILCSPVLMLFMFFCICNRPLHIAVVQGELAIVYRLIHLLLCARRSLDIYNNLRQVKQCTSHISVFFHKARF